MGRTKRRRHRRTSNCHNNNFFKFQNWMLSQGWKPTIKLKLKNFPDTGRGLMAMENIKSGDTLVKIPSDLLITAKTVSNSPIGDILKKSNINVPIHLVLTAFLVYENHLGPSSFWKEYMSVIPSKFTSPIFCSDNELNLFPKFIIDEVSTRRSAINNMYDIVMKIFYPSKCYHCDTEMAVIFSKETFDWAWFAVNSRVIFVPPEENTNHSIPLSDNNFIALAPYLDMLNHSNSSRVSTSFHSGHSYELTTLVPFKKYDEVFIHYGNHDNLKLFIDYGFILPENEHDILILHINDIIDSLTCPTNANKNLKYVQENCPKFLQGLNLSRDGLSWNCKALIYLLMCEGNIKFRLQNIYHETFDNSFLPVNIVGKIILDRKIQEINDKIESLNCANKNVILSIGVNMLQLYLSVLKDCDKAIS